MPGPRVLIVDDDAAVRRLLRVVSERAGLVVDEAVDGAHCLDLLEHSPYDLVLLDLTMARVSGFDVIEALGRRRERPAIIVVTALARWTFADIDPAVVQCIVRKPFDLDLVGAMIVATATALYERRIARGAAARPDEGDRAEVC